MADTVRVTRDTRGVATLWLARPDKHNALSEQMIDDLTRAAQALGADDTVRVVVLAAEGQSFCAGGDLGWMRAQMAADAPTRAAGARRLALMLRALDHLPKPLVGRVQGNAFGGGLGLMSVCDVAVAADTARFGLTETRLGLIPATIGPYVVARMGAARARRVFFSSRVFDAPEAVTLGLVARAVAPDMLDAAVEAEVAPYLSCAPGALAEAKALVRQLTAPIDDAVVEATIAALVARWESAEAAEGIAAFFDRREASWTGPRPERPVRS
ncbi:crotonase/enoyl-CoA hydratase family protein [Palleronia sp. KMU-117]|uniref:crotonase/enoyl-CoA hydratase family protein n=1 Tax=Palleronia sp. KMU-117 TaxID=3434108 RepID=UPI003D747A7E